MSQPKPSTLPGIGLMICAMLLFPLLDVFAKKLGADGQPAMQTVWARMALGAVILLPLTALVEGREGLRPRAKVLNTLRGLAIVLTTFFFFTAMHYQGIAETLSLYFIQPILVVALAPLILREQVGLVRWLAVLAGFIGVLVILQPFNLAIGWGSIFALLSGLCAAFVIITSRLLASKASALSNTFHTCVAGGVMTSLLMLWQWQQPDTRQWLMMFGIAVIGATCNYLIIKAFEWCEASLLAPFGYAEMINAVIFGWLFFGDFPRLWTFVGVAILVGAALYVSHHERKVALQDSPAQV